MQVIWSLQIGFRGWLGDAAPAVERCRRYLAQLSNLLITLNSTWHTWPSPPGTHLLNSSGRPGPANPAHLAHTCSSRSTPPGTPGADPPGTHLLITLNSASNFVVYCLCSRNFRAVLGRRLRCDDCRRRRRRHAAGGHLQCGSPPGQRVAMAVMPCAAAPAAVASTPDRHVPVMTRCRTASLPRTDCRVTSTHSRLTRVLFPFRSSSY